jgi:succinyl-diaminopimelate desuccinylase
MSGLDPVDLTAKLVRCASVTPVNDGALEVLEEVLGAAGFDCTRVDRGGICNLFARWGNKGNTKSFGFNGHTDVVPIGDEADWSIPPFGAEIKDGIMYGRGTTDMKSGVAAFVAAAVDFVKDTPPDGSIVLAISAFSGIQLLTLGIMGEYIGRLYIEAKGRPLYYKSEHARARAEDRDETAEPTPLRKSA